MSIAEQSVTDAISLNDFFHDFLFFLTTLRVGPLHLTKTGNLQRKEIDYFGKKFRIDIYHRDEKGNILYPIYTEDEVSHLQRIRLITYVMHLTYKRKGKLLLSSNGKGYLTKIGSQTQFEQMILWYFNRCNWEYMHPYLEDTASILQKNQQYIWDYFLQNARKSIDFQKFYDDISAYFGLKNSNPYHDPIKWAVETLLIKDLALYGLIEYTSRKKNKWLEEILSFTITPLGVNIFHKALFEPF